MIHLVKAEGRTVDELKCHESRKMRRGDENLSRRQVDTEAHRYGDSECQNSGEVQESVREPPYRNVSVCSVQRLRFPISNAASLRVSGISITNSRTRNNIASIRRGRDIDKGGEEDEGYEQVHGILRVQLHQKMRQPAVWISSFAVPMAAADSRITSRVTTVTLTMAQ